MRRDEHETYCRTHQWGDTPGMNAAILSVVRVGINKGWQVFGIRLVIIGGSESQYQRLLELVRVLAR